MDKLVLTREDILMDIKGYKNRIQSVQDRLSVLPATVATAKERKKITNRRRTLFTEIDHVRGLISIAEEDLN